MSDLNKHDHWLKSDAVAAIVIREPLVPVEGPDGVFFPPTFAAAEDRSVFPGGYNIDPPTGEKNVCLVDSVGSPGQSNRTDLRRNTAYAELVPQVAIDGRRPVGEPARCRSSRGRRDRSMHAPAQGTARGFQGRAQGERDWKWPRSHRRRLSLASGTRAILRRSSRGSSHRPSEHSTCRH